jgi:YD repeat-containing protein
MAVTHDDAGRRTSLTLPNGVVVNYSYDGASQLSGMTYQAGSTVLGCGFLLKPITIPA